MRVERLMLLAVGENEERKKIYAGNGLRLSKFALATSCAKMSIH